MLTLLSFTSLLQASLASDHVEPDCPAASVSLLQTQLQLDHTQHLAVEDHIQVKVNSTSLSDIIAALGSGPPESAGPYHQSCATVLKQPVVNTFSKYLIVLGTCMLFVVILVLIVLRSQRSGGERQLSRASPTQAVVSVGLPPVLLFFMAA